MLDTYVRFQSQPVVVNQQQAPTHESVDLLMKMEKAARDKIIDSGEVKNNTLEAKWYVENDFPHGYNLLVVLKINGIEYREEEKVKGFSREKRFEDIAAGVKSLVRKIVEKALLINAYTDSELNSFGPTINKLQELRNH